MRRATILPGVALAVLALATPAASQAPAPREGKPGGILRPHNATYNWARHQETWLDKVASEQGR